MRRRNSAIVWIAIAGLLTAGLGASLLRPHEPDAVLATHTGDEAARLEPLGLMTSLPIYWGEAESFADLLAGGEAEQHWVRRVLERDYSLLPLDTLWGENGLPSEELAGLDKLLLAQPYTLTPADNVALDRWVRDGGTLLMFADPVLTAHSHFPIGDKRRPQEVGLVPPVFARWGIAQSYDEGQAGGERMVAWNTIDIPVHRRGRFELLPAPDENAGECEIAADALIVRCRVGSGGATIVADAAVLSERRDDRREYALTALLRRAYNSK